MDVFEEIKNCLLQIRESTDIAIKKVSLDKIYNSLDSNEFDVSFLEDISNQLIDLIILENDKKSRSYLFEILEKACKKNLSVKPDFDRLVSNFSENEPAVIANTLLLMAVNGDKRFLSVAKTYQHHQNEFIRMNAENLIKSLDK